MRRRRKSSADRLRAELVEQTRMTLDVFSVMSKMLDDLEKSLDGFKGVWRESAKLAIDSMREGLDEERLNRAVVHRHYFIADLRARGNLVGPTGES